MTQMYDHNAMWPHPGLADLNYKKINWRADLDPLNCSKCTTLVQNHPSPVLCTYASTLAHVERVLGPLPLEPHERVRLMIVLQDPRPKELPVAICHPDADPGGLRIDETRYLCMTQAAWNNLRLGDEDKTGCPTPSWPKTKTAHHFLRRYFVNGNGQWSYEGMMAYFLWLLRPSQAYITNLAKCNFGVRHQPEKVFKKCGHTHLCREIEMFRPTVLLSFTCMIKIPADILKWTGLLPNPPPVVMWAYNPAYHMVSKVAKIQKLYDAIIDNDQGLSELGYDPHLLAEQWRNDAGGVLG